MPLWESIDMPVPIVTREAWGAVEPLFEQPLDTPVMQVNLLSSGTDECTTKEQCIKAIRELQKEHMDKGLPDIPYNFLVGGDGNAYEGRGFTTNPSKVGPSHVAYEGKSIDIAYLGDYTMFVPPRIASVAAFDLVDYGEGCGFIDPEYNMDITVAYKHFNV